MKNVFAALTLILCCALPGIAQESFQHEKKIDALVKPFFENEKFVAVSIGVILDGKIWTTNYGRLSQSDETAPTADTIYEIGSVSKVFTSLLLADAVAAGKVDLDQSMGTLMTEMHESNAEVGNKITLQHLSHHMSGLPRMPSNFSPPDPNNPFVGYDRKKLVAFMEEVKLR